MIGGITFSALTNLWKVHHSWRTLLWSSWSSFLCPVLQISPFVSVLLLAVSPDTLLNKCLQNKGYYAQVDGSIYLSIKAQAVAYLVAHARDHPFPSLSHLMRWEQNRGVHLALVGSLACHREAPCAISFSAPPLDMPLGPGFSNNTYCFTE